MGERERAIQCVADQGLKVEGRHWITVILNLITSGFPPLLLIYYLNNHKGKYFVNVYGYKYRVSQKSLYPSFDQNEKSVINRRYVILPYFYAVVKEWNVGFKLCEFGLIWMFL